MRIMAFQRGGQAGLGVLTEDGGAVRPLGLPAAAPTGSISHST